MINLIYGYGFWFMLPLTTAAAWIWAGEPGRIFTPERMVASSFFLAAAATFLFLPSEGSRYEHVELAAVISDILLTICLWIVALQADRWWPLWVTGLQLTSTAAHFARWFDLSNLPTGYQIVEQASSYPTQIILIFGIWHQHRRQKALPARPTSPAS